MNIDCVDRVLAHAITLSCREVGGRSELPRVLLLHGFPQAACAWDEVMLRLSGRARCVAPNLRGYERSSAPSELAAYSASALVSDIAALIETMGAPIDLLVAHDWGGALAWSLAAKRPQLLQHLLIINAPHPAIFLRELRDSPAQQRASAYMDFLCRPDAAALLAADDFARLWPFFTDVRGAAWLTDTVREQYRTVWRHGLEGPLNYYRASPLRPARAVDGTLNSICLAPAAVTVPVPTTVLWGGADVALPPALLDGLAEFVATLDVRRVHDAGHWIVQERPALVADTIASLLPA